jgi:hypothetical protein
MKALLKTIVMISLAGGTATPGPHAADAPRDPRLVPAPQAAPINPQPPQVVSTVRAAQWSFDSGPAGWQAQHECTLSTAAGQLRIRSTGEDPYLHCPLKVPGGFMLLRMLARAATGGQGEVFWTTDLSPRRGPDKSRRFSLKHDGQWRTYEVRFTAPGLLTDLRLDPGAAPGEFEIQSLELFREEYHPLSIEAVETVGNAARFQVCNARATAVDFVALGKSYRMEAGGRVAIDVPLDPTRPLAVARLRVESAGLPSLVRTAFIHQPQVAGDWLVRQTPDLLLRVARDGSMARIERAGRLAAIVAPLVHRQGELPRLRAVETVDRLRFEGDGVTLAIAAAGKEISIAIESDQPCEGPVVRALGPLKQGLLAGLEYLGAGERSSSTLDIETEEHLRYAPDPLQVTLPLMALVTDRGSLGLSWEAMDLRPTFATPNFFDGTPDHRMALRGRRIAATLRVDDGLLEELIAWAVGRHGLPPLPRPPRTRPEQWELCLKAINGPLRTAAGWGHCVEDHWPRHPFDSVASTLWRLTGQAPDLPRLVPGGAHVPNATIYFVTGRARQWLEIQRAQVEAILKRQQPDGSFRYQGKYARGHFEDTASGVCAMPVVTLLEYARATGDARALEAAQRTLRFMERFDVPRGAQVWEVPLHTPDQLASAYAVWACVRGFELTGNRQYLRDARRWALSGVPFVYLWSRSPIMLYATPPVFGATNWTFNWIGLPVQWVGGVYAYALAMLAPYDSTLDWNHLAQGILTTAEQMQYPDGPYAGLLPDSFSLADQERHPSRINPCALVSLRLALAGEVDFLSVASDGRHRVAAPLRVSIRDGKAHVSGRAGLSYQVLVDGRSVIDVTSRGDDTIDLP